MSLIFEKYSRNQLTLILLLMFPFVQYFAGDKGFWLYHILLLIVVLMERKLFFVSSKLLLLTLPLFWSFLFSLDSSFYEVVQSVFYLSAPILFTFLGMQYGKAFAEHRDMFLYCVYLGTVGSLIYLIHGVVNTGVGVFSDIYAFRRVLFWGSIANVITISLLLFGHKFEQPLFLGKEWKRRLLLFLNMLALFLTASRTYYFSLIVFVLLFLFVYNKKIFSIMLLTILLAIIYLFSLKSDSLMINKIQNSVSEINNSNEFKSYADVNTYYRAYETLKTLEVYMDGGVVELSLGHGMAKQVNLGIYVKLGEKFRLNIPIVHNGYAYLLLRTGGIGLLFYVLFFISFFVTLYQIHFNKAYLLFSLLLFGTAFSLLFSNYLVTTFFKTEMSVAWILIGYFLSQVNFLNRKTEQNTPKN